MCDCKKSNTNCNCQCPPAEKGDPGLNWVYIETAEAPGVNCPYGGYVVQGGPDANNDGIPDVILSQFYVCNAVPSAQYVVKTTAEAPGANCVYGGLKIESGIDTNGDGVPDSSVVTSYVCNGVPGDQAVSPTFVAGTVTSVPNGDPLNISVTEVSPGVFAIDMDIPEGPQGPTATVTDTSAIDVSNITIPSCLTDSMSGITTLQGMLNVILTKLCSMGNNTQSEPGYFAAILNQPFSFIGSATSNFVLSILNDFENGGFDNGSNWTGTRYITPVDGFTGPFTLQDIEVELMSDISAGLLDIDIDIIIKKYDNANVFIGDVATVNIVIDHTTAVVGDTLTVVPTATSALVLTAGQIIKVVVEGNVGSGTAQLKLNSLMLTNNS